MASSTDQPVLVPAAEELASLGEAGPGSLTLLASESRVPVPRAAVSMFRYNGVSDVAGDQRIDPDAAAGAFQGWSGR